MNKPSKNTQSGFTITEIVLGIALIGTLGVAGWYANQNRLAHTSPDKPTTTVKQELSTPTPVPAASSADAMAKVKSLLTVYLRANAQPEAAKPYIDPSYYGPLYDKKAFDPVLCSQGVVDPNQISYSVAAHDTFTTHIKVVEMFAGDGSGGQAATSDFTVRMKDLLITNIDCHL